MALKVGDIIGDYQVEGFLGQGGMGTVYRVRNLVSEREEALKIVLSEAGGSADLTNRFLREVKIHASLDHPNIAGMRTALRVNDQFVMIMELVDGATLEQRLSHGPVPVPQGIHWISSVLSALEYAHARSVIHRDVKPSNIMISPTDVVKLMDFGIARSETNPAITQAGVAVGSINYMSPEVVQGLEPDARSDVYSVGVTLFEVLTAHRPFVGKNDYEVMRAHLEQIPASPDSLNPHVPAALAAIVLKAIAKKPEDRFQNAIEFLDALQPFGAAPKTPSGYSSPARSPIYPETRSTPVRPVVSPSVGVQSIESPSHLYSNGSTPGVWDEKILAGITEELSFYVGPLARIIVNRTAPRARTIDGLISELAQEITSYPDRQRFTDGCHKLLRRLTH
jgi:serine/threonine protein kinase